MLASALLLGALAVALGIASHGEARSRATTPVRLPVPLCQRFKSRPDLSPPIIRVRTRSRGTSAGFIFIAPKLRVAQTGPMILDDAGNVVWFKPLDKLTSLCLADRSAA